MKIPKPTESDKARFESLVPGDSRVEVKPMFGNLGAFVNGNMFMGLFGADVGVKLADADQQQLVKAGGGPFGPEERPMSGYVTLPDGLTPAKKSQWVGKSLDYVGSLPPKKKKPAAKKK
jgi:TfoX/Sxy family transcriptional regulator of competence genes